MKKLIYTLLAAAALTSTTTLSAATPDLSAIEKTQPRVINNPNVDSTNVEYCQVARVTVSNGQTMVTIGVDLTKGSLPSPEKKASYLADPATGKTYKYKSAIGYKAKEAKEVDGYMYVTLVFKSIESTVTRLDLVTPYYIFYGIDLTQDGDGKILYNARTRAMDKLKKELPEGFGVEEPTN